MTISSTSANTSATGVTNAAVNSAASNGGLSSTDFLTLLVGELQNQDPLNPTDTTQFVNQMSEYATFDQQATLNTNLESMVSSFNGVIAANALNYVGHSVQVQGNSGILQNGAANFGYSLSSAAAQVNLSVQDASGATVWTGTGPTAAGMNAFTWNGQNAAGTQLPDGGTYKLTVSAVDSQGNSVLNYTTTTGVVSGVNLTSGTPLLDVAGTQVPLSSVVAVQ